MWIPILIRLSKRCGSATLGEGGRRREKGEGEKRRAKLRKEK
jgi:hypothetical protein